MKFRLLAGIHFERQPDGEVKRYSAKDAKHVVIRTDRNLEAIFGRSKFERVDYASDDSVYSEDEGDGGGVVVAAPPRAAKTAPKPPKPAPKPGGAPKPNPRPTTPKTAPTAEAEDDEGLGRDVTADFARAQELGILVFRQGSQHFLAEADSPTHALNDRPLAAKEVPAALEEFA